MKTEYPTLQFPSLIFHLYPAFSVGECRSEEGHYVLIIVEIRRSEEEEDGQYYNNDTDKIASQVREKYVLDAVLCYFDMLCSHKLHSLMSTSTITSSLAAMKSYENCNRDFQ